MPTNKELEVTLNDLADRVYALEENVVPEVTFTASDFQLDVAKALIRALIVTRSQGARRDAEALAAKYFPGSHVDDFTSDKFTTTQSLASATGE